MDEGCVVSREGTGGCVIRGFGCARGQLFQLLCFGQKQGSGGFRESWLNVIELNYIFEEHGRNDKDG